MSSSSPFPLNQKVRSITFFDGSIFTSANRFVTDVLFRKKTQFEGIATFQNTVILNNRLEINSDVIINGKVPYVDKQTGWGLPEWTFTGSEYNPETDSLIVKIYTLNDFLVSNYATTEYVINATTLNQGLLYSDPDTFPLYNQPGNYSKGVIHLSPDTYFIIRDTDENAPVFQFQRGAVGVGKYLRCSDDSGTVEWADITTEIPTLSGINTQNGTTSSASFYVTDTGIDGNLSTRGMFIYPNYDSSSNYNNKIPNNSIAILGGIGNGENGDTQWNSFFGSFGGNQGILCTSDYTSDLVHYRGYSEITGGGDNQRISLSSDGICITTEPQQPLLFELPGGSSLPKSQQGCHIKAVWPLDGAPVLEVSRTESHTSKKRSILTAPMLPEGAYNDIMNYSDGGLIYMDTSIPTPSPTSQEIFHIIPWSPTPYCEGISMRATRIIEETPILDTMYSGFVRMCGCTGYDIVPSDEILNHPQQRIPRNYLISDRRGISIKTENTKGTYIYSKISIQNKNGPLLNDPSSTTSTASLTVGSSASNVQSNFFGSINYTYSGSPSITGKLLKGVNESGLIQWGTIDEIFPSTITKSVTFTENITFQKDLKFTKNLPSMTSTKLYALGNDGTTGNIKWVEISVSENGTVEKPVNFNDNISLYNQMFFVDIDFGLLTAAVAGGLAYAAGQSLYSDQKKYGQYWSTPLSELTYYWRYEDSSQLPTFVYPFKINKSHTITTELKINNSNPPASDCSPCSDLQFYLDDLVVTDPHSVTLNSVNYNVSVSKPGNLDIAGHINYRQYNTNTQLYDSPAAGDILINWGGSLYTPNNILVEKYGRATWKSLIDILPRSVSYDITLEGNLKVGSEVNYTHNLFGNTQNVQKNISNLTIFGKLFYRLASSDTDIGSSPLNYILKCVNATTGEIGWAESSAILPSSASFDSLNVTTLTGGTINSNSFTNSTSATVSGNFYINGTQADVAINRVLVCTDATGKTQWRDISSIQSNDPVFNTVTASNFIVPNHKTTISEVNRTYTIYTNLTSNVTTVTNLNTNVTTSLSNTQYFDRTSNPANPVYHRFSSPYMKVFRMTHYANSSYCYSISLPITLLHRWSFYNNQGGLADEVAIYYELLTFDYQLVRVSDNVTVTGSIAGIKERTASMYFFRSTSKSLNKQYELHNNIYFKNVILNINIPKEYRSTQSDWEVSIRCNFQFWYRGEYIDNYDNVTNQVWPAFTVGIDPNYPSSPTNYFKVFYMGIDDTDNFISQFQGPFYDYVNQGSAPYATGSTTIPTYVNSATSLSYKRFARTGFSTTDNTIVTSYNNIQTNSLAVENDIFSPNGVIACCGYKCRPGSAQYYQSSAADYTNLKNAQYAGTRYFYENSSTYNINWTGNLDFYIDTTMVYRVAPNYCDYRLKENIRPIQNVASRICDLEVFQYDRRELGVMRKSANHIGVYAHQLQEVFPECEYIVNGKKDGVSMDGEPEYQTVSNEMIFLLFKAVQELKTEIESLKNEINYLKNLTSQ